MSGFSNNVMYAKNVSFNGTKAAEMVTDGQLIIGDSTGNPKVATLTAGTGISVTNGHGTISIAATNLNVNQNQIYYVGKHGNDANSGLNIENAKLTFGAAITAATALTPSATNRFVIECFDDGIYTESITTPPFVDVDAPNATLTGNLTVDDNCNIKFFQINAATGTTAITKPAGSAYSNVEIEIINLAGTANGCTLSTGFLNLTWKQLYVVDGFGIGDISVGLGHIHVKGGDIYISGTGIGLIRANTGTTVGHVDHILNIGAGTGSAIIVFDGKIDVVVNKIEVANAYQVQGATSVLNLFCNEIIGTRSASLGGTDNHWVPPKAMAAGQLVIGTSVTTDPSVANITPGPGVSVTNGSGTITIGATGMGLTWSTVSSSTPFVNNNGYIATGGAALSFSLPATSSVGDIVAIALDGSTSWTITQGAGQQIRIGSTQTTLGAGGSVVSSDQGDTIILFCSVANLKWNALTAIGNITIV